MLLAVDSGNTNVKFAVFEGDTLRAHWRLRTEIGRTSDQYAALLRTLFAQEGLSFEDIDGIAVCSSVPAVTPDISRLASSVFKRDPLIITSDIDLGLEIAYRPPTDVGTDRLADAAAAVALYGAPSIVVDFGTGTTFNAIGAPARDGGPPVYLGGAICPGIGLSLDALFARASRLSAVEMGKPSRAIGDTTARALQSGVLFGYAAQVDGLCARFRAELGASDCPTIATGGHATALILDECRQITAREPFLTLQGLRIAYDRAQRHP